MAAALTFSTLTAQLKLDLERGQAGDADAIAQIPHWIMLAEKNIAAEAKPEGFERWIVSDAAIAANTTVVQKPVRWRKTISLAHLTQPGYTVKTYLKERVKEYLEVIYPNSATTAALPRFWASFGPNHFLILPAPSAVFKLALGYYEELQPLDDANQTNWLTQFAPQVLLYRCLMEAMVALKNDERLPTWQAMYGAGVKALMGEDFSKSQDRTYSTESR